VRKTLLVILVSFLVVFYGTWFVFPEDVLKSAIVDHFSYGDLSIEIDGFKKGLFYCFDIERLTFKKNSDVLMLVNNVHSKINFFKFFLLHLDMSINGGSNDEVIEGKISIIDDNISGNLIFKGWGLENIGAIKLFGINAKGKLMAKISFDSYNLQIEFSVNDLVADSIILKGSYIPLNLFQKFNGFINKKGNVVEISSLYFEGNNLIGRLKGKIVDSDVNCFMEIMPGKGFIDEKIYFPEIEKYKVSPGYYVIPIKD